MLALLIARGGTAGADALAYWGAVRVWLAGADPYAPPDPFLPYPYAPWMLPLLLPFGALPWSVAWFAWRGFNILALALSMKWAYDRRRLATALVFLAMSPFLTATLDTGNVTFVLAMAVWVAQFTGPRVGGALWALTVSTKWFPLLLFPLLPPRTRPWGLAALAVAVLLSLATLPQTLTWVTTMLAFPRPPRIDYVLLLWAAIPWAWSRPGVLSAWRPSALARRLRERRDVGRELRTFLGLGQS